MPNLKPIKVPSRIRVQVDSAGITARNDRGDEIHYPASPSAHGFNPLELLSASLAICTAINVRRELGVVRQAGEPFEVVVECIKAQGQPSRVERLTAAVHLPPGTAGAAADELVHRAQIACTIENTLRASAQIDTRVEEFAGTDPLRGR